MDALWDDTRLFLAVAEAGSLGKAAKRLGIAQPTVSRRLAEVERRYGFALFRREPQGVTLTARGSRLLEPARRMAEWAAELDRAAVDPRGGPRGIVRITAAPGVAVDFVAPFAAWLKVAHPALVLEVLSSVGVLDLSRGEADLAIRPSSRAKDDLVQLASLEQEIAFFATPEYAAKLPRHYGYGDVDFVGWCPPYDMMPPNPQLAARIPDFSPVFSSDSFLAQLAAAEAGIGAVALPRLAHRFSRPSRLVALVLDLGPAKISRTSLVASRGALQIPRVRLVGELLAKEFERARVLTKKASRPSGR